MNDLAEFNDMVDRVCGKAVPNKPRGFFIFKCFAKPRTPIEKKRGYGEAIWEDVAKNGTTIQGVTSMMNAFWNGTSPTGGSTFYMGLIYTASGGLSTSDTLNSHGFVEFTNYTSWTNRLLWGQGTASANTITNATQVSFTISSGGQSSVYGAFICNQQSGSSSSSVLYSTSALLGGTQSVSPSQTLSITYTSVVTPG